MYDYNLKVKKIKEISAEKGFDLLVIQKWEDIFYTTGIRGTTHSKSIFYLIPSDSEKEPILILPSGFKSWLGGERFEDYFPHIKESATYSYTDNVIELVVDMLERLATSNRKIGIEKARTTSELVPAATLEGLIKYLPKAEFEDCTWIIDDVRMVKTKNEKNLMKKACQISDNTHATVRELLRPGLTDTEIAREIYLDIIKQGGEGWGFAAEPCIFPRKKTRRIEEGDLLTIDISAMYKGYFSDYSRVAVVGQPTRKQKRIFKTVRDVQEKTIEILKPGLKASEVYAFAREEVKKAGYLKYFVHFVGHGLGIEVDEKPHIKFDDNTVLKPGMIITIEPEITLPDLDIYIEDEVVITTDGYEVLSKAPKDL